MEWFLPLREKKGGYNYAHEFAQVTNTSQDLIGEQQMLSDMWRRSLTMS